MKLVTTYLSLKYMLLATACMQAGMSGKPVEQEMACFLQRFLHSVTIKPSPLSSNEQYHGKGSQARHY